jgi:hypothetical protein
MAQQLLPCPLLRFNLFSVSIFKFKKCLICPFPLTL